MIAVCNASPVIALSLVGRFQVLTDLFDDLRVPAAVMIVLAQETDADFVILDERRARNAAERVGLTPIGTIGLLRLWCETTGEPLRPASADLLQTGFHVSDELIQSILGEDA